MSILSDLGLADLKALEAQIRAQKKDLVAQEQVRVASFLQEYLDDQILAHTGEDDVLNTDSSEKSTWVGFKAFAVPMVGADGRPYTVSVTITDVDAKAAKDEAAKTPATPAPAPEPESTDAPETEKVEEPAKG